jgi:hypothetical protein
MIKIYINEKIMIVTIYYKVQIYFLKTIQMIIKLDEVLNHILHMTSLSHFNSIWKVPFIWFHEKLMDEV